MARSIFRGDRLNILVWFVWASFFLMILLTVVCTHAGLKDLLEIWRSKTMSRTKTSGTPRTIGAAVFNGLTNSDPRDPVESWEENITAAVRDFLSQKFGAAMLRADRLVTTQEILNDLWFQITGEKIK